MNDLANTIEESKDLLEQKVRDMTAHHLSQIDHLRSSLETAQSQLNHITLKLKHEDEQRERRENQIRQELKDLMNDYQKSETLANARLDGIFKTEKRKKTIIDQSDDEVHVMYHDLKDLLNFSVYSGAQQDLINIQKFLKNANLLNVKDPNGQQADPGFLIDRSLLQDNYG